MDLPINMNSSDVILSNIRLLLLSKEDEPIATVTYLFLLILERLGVDLVFINIKKIKHKDTELQKDIPSTFASKIIN